MNIFQGQPLGLELKTMKILQITITLIQRSSMMPSTFSMFRHPMIIYCPSYVHFRGLYAAGTAARDSKSREKVYLKRGFALPAMRTGLYLYRANMMIS